MFNKLKEGASKAGLEAEYLKKKATKDFKHPGEPGEYALQLRTLDASIHKFKDHVSTLVNTFKSNKDAYSAAATDLTTIANQSKNGHLERLSQTYLTLSEPKKMFFDSISGVLQEMKTFITTDLKKVVDVEETANRALTERDYYKGDKGHEEKYQIAAAALIAAVKEFSVNANGSIEQWTRKLVEAEANYYQAAAQIISSGF